MHKPESVSEKETQEILKDFEVQIDYQILARRPDWGIINKHKKRRKKRQLAE